jgi:hypothetical protein
MRGRAFKVFVSIVLVLGVGTGYRLSGVSKLEPFKLLNVTGLFYDFLGVLVLSEFVSSNPKLKRVSVEIVAPGVLWLQSVFPFGVILGGLLGMLARAPSSVSVGKFAMLFWAYSVLPLALLEGMVVFPQFAVLKSVESRWQWFGFFLLLSGVMLQLVAAVMGLGE